MDRRGFNRRVILGGAAVATTSLSTASEAASASTTARTAPAGGEVRRIKMYAERLSGGRMGYGFERARRPSPAR